MPDLEDVLSNLNKFKEKMKESIKFIERLEKLFGMWDAQWDTIGEGTISLEDLLNIINKILIYKK